MDSIQINTGEKRIAINDDSERVIVFNPSDVVFAEKFYKLRIELGEAQAEFKRRAEEIEARTIVDDDGIPNNTDELIQYVKDINSLLRSKIDALFGVNTSYKCFGDVLSFDMDMYRQFFEGIAPFIQAARAEKVARYTTNASAKRHKHS